MELVVFFASILAAFLTGGDAPSWRFRQPQREVKVVVLHGSVGAWQRNPYHQHLENVCANVEVRNLSKSGLGAWAIKKRFQEMVLRSGEVRPKSAPDQEFWLLFGAGLNSVTASHKTNHHLRNLIVLAHGHGMKVMGLTPTPWGSDADERFVGLDGFVRRRATQHVADYILSRLDPGEALGSYASERENPDAKWESAELADIGVDVYDAGLRDRDAQPRDSAVVRAALERSSVWVRRHKDLSDTERDAALGADVALGVSVPQYYMKPALRAFDHIHPNAEGHKVLAQTICAKAPASWGCDCDAL